MNAWLGVMQSVLLTAGLFGGLTAMAIGCLYSWWRPRLQRIEPARRARLITALCVAPATSALLYTALCFGPGLLGTIWPGLDHCLTHGGHDHLCFIHPPRGAGSSLGWAIVGLGSVVVLAPLLRGVSRFAKSSRILRSTLREAKPCRYRDALLVQSAIPLAATSPISDKVLLSTALVHGVRREVLRVVMAHERAHLERRDPLRRLVAFLAVSVYLPTVRRQFLEDLELACEQACDERAAVHISSRTRVAKALVEVERLFRADPQPALTGFGGSHVEERVAALLAPPPRPSQTRSEAGWLLTLVVVSMLLAEPLHHTAETLIGLLGA